MITLVEPKPHIDRLWGKQRVEEGRRYRLMRYVFRVNHDGKVLLHNVVTGRLVVLDQAEADMLGSLPSDFCPEMEPLITEHYLVPEDYDEHRQAVNLKRILHQLLPAQPAEDSAITNYTILPTTACNARCYYCYECDVRKVTMTERTADDTVRFITEHCGPEKKVNIRWFGGEPTVAAGRIDQICEGLHNRGVRLVSNMTTNGYLFDDTMVSKAKRLWNLREVMISVDGTEKHYNEIKDYVNAQDNPYQRVLRNVELLLNHGIQVNLRMNFDVGNYPDFMDLLAEARVRYGHHRLLHVYAFPVKGEYPDKTGEVHHGGLAWSVDKLVELNDAASAAGFFRRSNELPSLFFANCAAGNPASMVITPEGNLARCTGIFDRKDQFVGTVSAGFTEQNYCDAWRHLADPAKCTDCTLYPGCILIEGCPGGAECFRREDYHRIETAMKDAYTHRRTDTKGGMNHGFTGTEDRICAN